MSVYGYIRRNVRAFNSIVGSAYNIIRKRDVIYPIQAEIAKGKASGIIPKPNYSGKVRTGPVPHGLFHKLFYGSDLGKNAKPGEKFAYLRRLYRGAKAIDYQNAKQGIITDQFKTAKSGLRAAAFVQKTFYKIRNTQVALGKLLALHGGFIGKAINKFARTQTLNFYRRSLKGLQKNPSLKFIPYAHTNLIREKAGAIGILGLAIGSSILAYRNYKQVKKQTKDLVGRLEHNKRISEGLKKSTKIKHNRK